MTRARVCRALALILAFGAGASCVAEPRVGERRVPPPRPEDVVATLFLLGDGGAPARDGDPVLDALHREVRDAGEGAIVAFLGDNIYPAGLPADDSPDRAEAERRLADQLSVVVENPSARGVLIAGNHDWTFATNDGWESVRRQERFAESMGGGRIEFLPGDGCPGPVYRDFGDALRLIALDTEWWVYRGTRPEHPDSACTPDSEEEVADSLRALLAASADRRVVVIGHHPLLSGGPHGGYHSWTAHLFPLRDLRSWLVIPLPGVGSTYAIARRAGVSQEDFGGVTNQRMRGALQESFTEHPPLVYASGHDHSLQVMEDVGARYQVVSGAGYYGHTTRVQWLENTLYAARESGYVRIDVQRDGRVRLGAIVVDALGGRSERFSMYLEDE